MTSDVEPDGCCQVVDLLVDYLEDRLPSQTRQALDTHLKACESCVQQLHTYRATVSLLRGLRDDDLPDELRKTVSAFLDSQTAH